jgi:hypothetical protein
MRVEIEPGVPITAKTVADLRALPTWPDGMALNNRFTSESPTIERFARADRAIASDVVFFISSQKGSTDA